MRYILPTFFFCCLSFSQAKDSIATIKVANSYDFSLKLDSLLLRKPNLNVNFKTNQISSVSIYNRNNKLNDIYYLSNYSIYYAKTVSLNSHPTTPKDSFNPHGASTIGVGLIMGSITTVFNSVFKL